MPVVAGLVVVLVGAVAAVVATGSEPQKVSAPSTPATGPGAWSSPAPIAVAPSRPIEPVTVAVASPPTAELGEIVEGNTSIGGRFYLVDYANTGSVAIARPSVVASGFDSANHRVVEQPGYAARNGLAPGEHTIVLVLIAEPPPAMERVVIVVRPPQARDEAPELALDVVESSERPSGSMHQLVGTVRNGGSGRVRFARVLAIGRDANGRAVSFAEGMPTRYDLAAGEESGFELSIGTFEVSRPARWELIAFGQPG